MARDRQRAKQRRRRQGGSAPRGASGTGRTGDARDIGLDDSSVEDAGLGEGTSAPDRDGTPAPDPLKHASAEVDQAKLAEAGATPPEVGDEDDAYAGEYDDLDDTGRAPDEAEDDHAAASAQAVDPAIAAERSPRKQRGRVLTFIGHCADELRRVQWPNRRQVGQATAVVLGFVVLAGGYLGLLDALWKPLIDAIL